MAHTEIENKQIFATYFPSIWI